MAAKAVLCRGWALVNKINSVRLRSSQKFAELIKIADYESGVNTLPSVGKLNFLFLKKWKYFLYFYRGWDSIEITFAFTIRDNLNR